MKFEMIEVYGGNDDRWDGWHNLILNVDGNAGNSKPIQGPIDPVTSEEIIKALDINNESRMQRAQYKELLQRCRDAICEAGYEDHSIGLIDDIDKAL